jgi:hypothetical protein
MENRSPFAVARHSNDFTLFRITKIGAPHDMVKIVKFIVFIKQCPRGLMQAINKKYLGIKIAVSAN